MNMDSREKDKNIAPKMCIGRMTIDE